MNRQVQKTGVRKYFGADLVELQSEPLAALDAFFAEYGPCVVQGCGITDNADGTYDIAPGLVALTGTDPEGVQRVMVMPFAGASGVALPLYLTAQAQVVERVYGDGKVKPVAHAYTAQAAGVLLNAADGKPLPHLTLTAEGGNRFVDAVQDTAHRFISDAERSKWNRILEQAKAYADSVATTGSAAALRSAKEYTDTRETAILAQADTKDAAALRSAKEYADQVVAALVDGSPEALNTLQELAAALGGDPNFATTVMQLIGERASMAQVNAALEGKVDVAGSLSNMFKALYFEDNQGRYNIPITGVGYTSDVERTNVHRFCTIDYFKTQLGLWHSGNFDPAGKADVVRKSFIGGINNADFTPGLAGCDVSGIELSSILTMPGFAGGYATQLRIRDYAGGFAASIRGEQTKTWRELWHTGNFDPTNASVREARGMAAMHPDNDNLYPGVSVAARFINPSSGIIRLYVHGGGAAYYDQVHVDYASRVPWGGIIGKTTATVSADGLMAAADKQKLDSQPRTIWGSVNAGGGKVCGSNSFSSQLSGEYIQIIHGIGHTSYSITATAICNNDPSYIDNTVTIFTKAATYCLIAVGYGGSTSRIERTQVDFTIVY